MLTAIRHTFYMARRYQLALIRQPIWIIVTLVQPVIWLLLFGALFSSIVEIPGFEATDYKQFLTPGIVVMTALFASGWSGMSMIEDMKRGVLDRFLVTPVRRGAVIGGRLMQDATSLALQSLIVVGLALLVGSTFPGGPLGVLVLIVIACFLGGAIAGFSNALALVIRKEESLIGLVQFVMLPLTFVSAAFMQPDLMPSWMQTVADFNPVNWAVVAGREAVMSESIDWGFVGIRLLGLAALLAVATFAATRAFRAYQRSV